MSTMIVDRFFFFFISLHKLRTMYIKITTHSSIFCFDIDIDSHVSFLDNFYHPGYNNDKLCKKFKSLVHGMLGVGLIEKFVSRERGKGGLSACVAWTGKSVRVPS